MAMQQQNNLPVFHRWRSWGGGGGFPGFLYETLTGGGSEREKKKAFEQDIEEHWREGTHTENTIRHYLDWGMNLAGRRVTTSHNTMRYQGRTWFCPLRLWVFVYFIATKRFVLWGTLWRGEGRGGEGKKGGGEGKKGGREGRKEKGKDGGLHGMLCTQTPTTQDFSCGMQWWISIHCKAGIEEARGRPTRCYCTLPLRFQTVTLYQVP